MIELVRITEMEQLTKLMPFFLEGYESMVAKAGAKGSREGFIKTLVGVLNSYPQNAIVVAYSGAEPLGFGVAFENTPEYEKERTWLLYGLYSKGTFGRVPRLLMDECERLAKELGYQRLEAQSGRMSGSALKFFTKKLGLTKSKILYTKEIT